MCEVMEALAEYPDPITLLPDGERSWLEDGLCLPTGVGA